MLQILIKHKVTEYASWKDAFDSFASFRKANGEKSYRILHTADAPNDLTLLFDWDSKENAETFLASPELKTTMQKAGVIEAPQITFMNQVAEGKL